MKKNKLIPTTYIVVNGKRCKLVNNSVYIKENQNFSLIISNDTVNDVKAKVYLNDMALTPDNIGYIIYQNEEITIDKFSTGQQVIFSGIAEFKIEFYYNPIYINKISAIKNKSKFGRLLLQEFKLKNTCPMFDENKVDDMVIYKVYNSSNNQSKLPNSCKCGKRIRSKTWNYCPECGTKLI